MLRYHILVFRIVPILSIINFALTAPVLVQDSEEHQANVNVARVPKDVLMKRGDGDIAKLAEEYLTPTWGKPVDSSDTHTLSGTAPDPASSTTNPDPSCSPSMQGLGARGNCFGLPESSAPPVPVPDHGPTDAVELSPIRPELSIDDLYPPMEAPSRTPGSSLDSYLPWNGPYTSGPHLRWSGYGSEDNSDTWYLLDKVLPPPEFSSHPVSPSSYSPTQTKIYAHSDPGTVKLEDGVDHVPLPPPDPELTAPELQLDHQSLGTDSQPDLSPAAYAAKGKTKVSRRVSGTAKDVGNVAVRELRRPAEELAWE